jgi:hypothetical protein
MFAVKITASFTAKTKTITAKITASFKKGIDVCSYLFFVCYEIQEYQPND